MSVRELLPLSVDGSGGYVSPGGFFLTSADGIEIVATCWDGAIAAEIVRACNSHEALVEALSAIVEWIEEINPDTMPVAAEASDRSISNTSSAFGGELVERIRASRAALALAEAK